jgi:hypothetical protein
MALMFAYPRPLLLYLLEGQKADASDCGRLVLKRGVSDSIRHQRQNWQEIVRPGERASPHYYGAGGHCLLPSCSFADEADGPERTFSGFLPLALEAFLFLSPKDKPNREHDHGDNPGQLFKEP